MSHRVTDSKVIAKRVESALKSYYPNNKEPLEIMLGKAELKITDFAYIFSSKEIVDVYESSLFDIASDRNKK